jgi:hypothetical protein
MELSIAVAESSSLPMQEPMRNKLEGHRFEKSTAKVEGKQSLVVNSTTTRVPTGVKRNDRATPVTFQKGERKKPSLKERQEKVYPFPDSDISRMLDDLLEANIIELPEVKRPDEANQMDNPNYCKYHRLISHPVEKCFVLKDKIMRLHKNGDIVFDDEVATSNITTMVNLGPRQSLPTISFGSFEPIELGIIMPTSFIASSSQTPCITLTPHVDNSKPDSSENYDDEGWTLVMHRRGRKRHMQMTKPTRMRISTVRKLIEPTRRKIQRKSIPFRNEGFSTQSLRKPVTLNEYMPIEMRRIENVLVACYHVDEEKTHTKPVMKENHDDSSNLSHGVCTTEISFNNEDSLLGSKLYNRSLFIKGYVDEKMMNRILVDDGSAVNILPLKTMKELGIPMDELFPSHLMIQSFNQGGQNTIGKIRLAIHMEDMKFNAFFHVIDAKTTYNMLLGRPWIHENGIISSTLHQCFKYCQDGGNKFLSKWDGPYMVQEVYTNGAYKIVDENGLRIGPINDKFLKRYHA